MTGQYEQMWWPGRRTRDAERHAERARKEVLFWKHELEETVLEKNSWRDKYFALLSETGFLRQELARTRTEFVAAKSLLQRSTQPAQGNDTKLNSQSVQELQQQVNRATAQLKDAELKIAISEERMSSLQEEIDLLRKQSELLRASEAAFQREARMLREDLKNQRGINDYTADETTKVLVEVSRLQQSNVALQLEVLNKEEMVKLLQNQLIDLLSSEERPSQRLAAEQESGMDGIDIGAELDDLEDYQGLNGVVHWQADPAQYGQDLLQDIPDYSNPDALSLAVLTSEPEQLSLPLDFRAHPLHSMYSNDMAALLSPSPGGPQSESAGQDLTSAQDLVGPSPLLVEQPQERTDTEGISSQGSLNLHPEPSYQEPEVQDIDTPSKPSPPILEPPLEPSAQPEVVSPDLASPSALALAAIDESEVRPFWSVRGRTSSGGGAPARANSGSSGLARNSTGSGGLARTSSGGGARTPLISESPRAAGLLTFQNSGEVHAPASSATDAQTAAGVAPGSWAASPDPFEQEADIQGDVVGDLHSLGVSPEPLDVLAAVSTNGLDLPAASPGMGDSATEIGEGVQLAHLAIGGKQSGSWDLPTSAQQSLESSLSGDFMDSPTGQGGERKPVRSLSKVAAMRAAFERQSG